MDLQNQIQIPPPLLYYPTVQPIEANQSLKFTSINIFKDQPKKRTTLSRIATKWSTINTNIKTSAYHNMPHNELSSLRGV